MTVEYLSCPETAKLLRAALKAAFPGVRFGVRSDTYSGGASVSVRWTDGPTETGVHEVTDPYGCKLFNGLDDSSAYRDTTVTNPDGTVHQFRSGADYVFVARTLSDDFRSRMEAAASRVLGEPVDPDRWYTNSYRTDHGVWSDGSGSMLVRWLADRVDGGGR